MLLLREDMVIEEHLIVAELHAGLDHHGNDVIPALGNPRVRERLLIGADGIFKRLRPCGGKGFLRLLRPAGDGAAASSPAFFSALVRRLPPCRVNTNRASLLCPEN